MTKRAYRHLCFLTRALDVVGERWTLLIVRELLLGPQRYKDLLDALSGIGTNLLAVRLKTLEGAGVVTRRTLPPPAGSSVYELTDLGEDLGPVVVALAQWGARLMEGDVPEGGSLARWAMLGMLHQLFRPDLARGVRETYEFRVDDEVFHLRVNDGVAKARQGPAADPDVVIITDVETFCALAAGELSPIEAVSSGRGRCEGDLAAVVRCAHVLGLQSPVPLESIGVRTGTALHPYRAPLGSTGVTNPDVPVPPISPA